MAHTIVIFGASGDLTSRKLIPALYELHRKKRLPENTRIVGFSRTKYQRRRLARETCRHDGHVRGQELPNRAVAAVCFLDLLPSRRPGHGRRFLRRWVPTWPPWKARSGRRGSIISPPRRSSMARRWPNWARRGWPRKIVRRAGSSSKNPSAPTWPPPGISTARCTTSFPSTRSIASTTIWARKPCKTCSCCASPTAFSSRSGTATTSTTCRSRRPRI